MLEFFILVDHMVASFRTFLLRVLLVEQAWLGSNTQPLKLQWKQRKTYVTQFLFHHQTKTSSRESTHICMKSSCTKATEIDGTA